MTISSNRTPTAATALAFLRDELTSLQAYTPHPGGAVAQSVQIEIDRVETNESPYDLPLALKQELAQIWTDRVESNRYPDGGHDRLKDAIAADGNERDLDVDVPGLQAFVDERFERLAGVVRDAVLVRPVQEVVGLAERDQHPDVAVTTAGHAP